MSNTIKFSKAHRLSQLMNLHPLAKTVTFSVFLPLVLFAILAIAVVNSTAGYSWELELLQNIHAKASPKWDQIAKNVTRLGGFVGVVPIAAILLFGLLLNRHWRSGIFLSSALVGSAVLNLSAKLIFGRDRPQLWISIAPQTDYSFPSGHATASMTLVIVVLLLAWRTRWFGSLLAVGALFAMAIAWTRLYLGVHYPTDILGGWLLSLIWAISCYLIVQPQDRYQRTSNNINNLPTG
jgi:undecaprenyl-diphosphatase